MTLKSFTLSLLLGSCALIPTLHAENGTAVAIVFDTSGSMGDSVPANKGKERKYIIASHALEAVVEKIDAYAKTNKVEAGLLRFNPNSDEALAGVKFGAWDAKSFRAWLKSFQAPEGGTPLGATILAASKNTEDSPLNRKHVVVITDGENNGALSLENGVKQGQEYARKKGDTINYYFIAFDANATQFAALKRKGSFVVSASDEKELNRALTTIFADKILLEDE